MSEIEARFRQAADDVKRLAERPGHDTLLKLYALYKQGTRGDVCGPQPGFFDFIGTAKHEAWAQLKGLAQDEAMRKYIELAEKLRG
ncbi:MAG: acyl-CoA-binding protein [Rhodanobacteraceae bacterium]